MVLELPIYIKRLVMKKLYLVLATTLMVWGAFCQVGYPSFHDSLIKMMHENTTTGNYNFDLTRLDSNTEYRNLKDGIIMQSGQLKVVRSGRLYLLNNPVTLKNGTIVTTNGIINMTNGSTPSLNEEDYIDMDGNIRPLQKQINN
jgi:hypothetical protein